MDITGCIGKKVDIICHDGEAYAGFVFEHSLPEDSDIGEDSVLLECKLSERRNNELIALLRSKFKQIEVVRGGAVAIESISTSCR